MSEVEQAANSSPRVFHAFGHVRGTSPQVRGARQGQNKCKLHDAPDDVHFPGTLGAEALDVVLDNARVHGRGTIRLAVRYLDDALAFDASDEGTVHDGAPLFDRGHSGEVTGAGIGLALTRELAISLIRGGGNRLLRLDMSCSSPGPGGTALARCGPR